MEIEFAQSARRHKVGQARARHVIEHPYLVIRQPAPQDSPVSDDRFIFLGDDPTGRALEVVAVGTGHGLLVIHAMDLRVKWQAAYQRGKDS